MAKWRNGEGYADPTAEEAINRVSREEREKEMAKRNCRRTTDENAIHEKAVKMRKMTDEQLVRYVEDRVEKARSEGFNRGREDAPEGKLADDDGIMEDIVREIVGDIGHVKGIGIAKLESIREILEKWLVDG